jgi:hypothetical protein
VKPIFLFSTGLLLALAAAAVPFAARAAEPPVVVELFTSQIP